MNLRVGHWNLPLVKRLSNLATVLKMNESEAMVLAELSGTPHRHFSLDVFCPFWAAAHEIDVLCITLGEAGCCVYSDGSVQRFPGYSVTVADTVGAGDAFAAAFLHGFHEGRPLYEIPRAANALGAIVASRAGATPIWQLSECLALASSEN